IAHTALNHLRQFVAAVWPDAGPWWTIDLAGRVAVPDVPLGFHDVITAARVRIDVALARLTVAEAAGRRAPPDEVVNPIGTAWEVECLPDAMDGQRRRALDEAFAALCSTVVGRPGGTSAPATLLAALAQRRAPDRAEHSSASAEVLGCLLDGLAGG